MRQTVEETSGGRTTGACDEPRRVALACKGRLGSRSNQQPCLWLHHIVIELGTHLLAKHVACRSGGRAAHSGRRQPGGAGVSRGSEVGEATRVGSSHLRACLMDNHARGWGAQHLGESSQVGGRTSSRTLGNRESKNLAEERGSNDCVRVPVRRQRRGRPRAGRRAWTVPSPETSAPPASG